MLTSNDDLASWWVAEDFFRLTFYDDSILCIWGPRADGFTCPEAMSYLTVRKLSQLLFAGQEQQLVAVRISSPVDAPGVDVIRIAVV